MNVRGLQMVVLAGMISSVAAVAQNAMVRSETIKARAIEGYLEDTNGYAVQNARVELFHCPASWPDGPMDGDVLRSVETDGTGKFKIEDVNGDQLRCVRFHKKGFQPVIVRVKLTMMALNKMRVKLEHVR